MKFLKIALATTAIFGMAATAQAQDTGAYVNLGVDAVEFDSYNLSAKLGYNINEYFGVEGQAAFGIIDDKETFEGEEFKAGIDSSFGAFGVVRLPAGENFDLFARAGYAFTKVGASAGNVSVSADADGFAGGVGGQYMFDDMNGVRLEYTYYDLNFDDIEAGNQDFEVEDAGGDVVTLSYVRKF
ncbi:porin family protein [Litorimonas sp. RW-G-Af-16]|uniref:porin family protein n=1 Tax=Litorimonas sp. RW-G-Af-16 TaxID=3241168 RepID=UPI00390CB22B